MNWRLPSAEAFLSGSYFSAEHDHALKEQAPQTLGLSTILLLFLA